MRRRWSGDSSAPRSAPVDGPFRWRSTPRQDERSNASHHLALKMKITFTPVNGKATIVTRSVALHA